MENAVLVVSYLPLILCQGSGAVLVLCFLCCLSYVALRKTDIGVCTWLNRDRRLGLVQRDGMLRKVVGFVLVL